MTRVERGALDCEGDSEHCMILILLEIVFDAVFLFLPVQNILMRFVGVAQYQFGGSNNYF
jgi:hypothetical protein